MHYFSIACVLVGMFGHFVINFAIKMCWSSPGHHINNASSPLELDTI